MQLSLTVRPKSRHLHSSPHFLSVLCLLRCSCYLASRVISSCRSPKQWSLLCWLLTFFLGRSSRRWPSTCYGEKNTKRELRAAIRSCDFRSVSKKHSKNSIIVIEACWKFASTIGVLF